MRDDEEEMGVDYLRIRTPSPRPLHDVTDRQTREQEDEMHTNSC